MSRQRSCALPYPGSGGGATVDCHRAFVLPRGFSGFYSCAIPPAQNRFAPPIRVGEERVLWKKPRY
ncbi:DUF1684 domain-containing protein [Nonomuraea sp. NPDC050536]|uniref:DUF1684 domain-containing protein n=1 Tax=Nonomuraea sp. NPDC050536 TaxID=3364366 RepID=UPI0037C99052